MESNEKTRLTYPSERARPSFYEEWVQPCLAELIGTMLFVFIGTLSSASGSTLSVALAHGFALALLVTIFGHISGGHFNPAVSFGVALGGGLHPLKCFLYLLMQVIGGIVGAALTRGSMDKNTYRSVLGGCTMIGPNATIGSAILVESAMTLILVLTVQLAAVDTKGKNLLAPLMIGFTVLVDIIGGGSISGASMNPARSIGPAVVFSSIEDKYIWDYHYIHWVGPLIGSLFAAFFFRIFFAAGDRRAIDRDN